MISQYLLWHYTLYSTSALWFSTHSEKLVMIKPYNWTYFAYIGLKRHNTIKCPTYWLFSFLLVASFDFRLSPFSIPQLQDTFFYVHIPLQWPHILTIARILWRGIVPLLYPFSHNCQDPVTWYCPFTKPFSHNCQDPVTWYCPFTKPFSHNCQHILRLCVTCMHAQIRDNLKEAHDFLLSSSLFHPFSPPILTDSLGILHIEHKD
jgi:hypothetical protein